MALLTHFEVTMFPHRNAMEAGSAGLWHRAAHQECQETRDIPNPNGLQPIVEPRWGSKSDGIIDQGSPLRGDPGLRNATPLVLEWTSILILEIYRRSANNPQRVESAHETDTVIICLAHNPAVLRACPRGRMSVYRGRRCPVREYHRAGLGATERFY